MFVRKIFERTSIMIVECYDDLKLYTNINLNNCPKSEILNLIRFTKQFFVFFCL